MGAFLLTKVVEESLVFLLNFRFFGPHAQMENSSVNIVIPVFHLLQSAKKLANTCAMPMRYSA